MGRLPGLKTDQCVFLWLESVSPADSPLLIGGKIRAAKTPWNIYRSGFICLKFRQMRFSPAISLRHTRPPRIDSLWANIITPAQRNMRRGAIERELLPAAGPHAALCRSRPAWGLLEDGLPPQGEK
jgi:hypothetical protein